MINFTSSAIGDRFKSSRTGYKTSRLNSPRTSRRTRFSTKPDNNVRL